MNVLIAEDERPASERLHKLLLECDPDIRVVEKKERVSDIVAFFNRGGSVDLMLLDIELADGNCFRIFDDISADVPVIFTNGDDQYAREAFRFHAVDYILKPVHKSDLEAALQKFRKMSNAAALSNAEVAQVRSLITEHNRTYRQRFIIRSGNKFIFRHTSDVALFFADGKSTYLVVRNDNRQFLIDYTLEELEHTLDPAYFFRISRKYIVNVEAIAEVRGLVSTRLEVRLSQSFGQSLHVSRDRAPAFRKWLDR